MDNQTTLLHSTIVPEYPLLIHLYPYWIHVIIFLLSACFCVVGTIGNILVVISVARFKEMKTNINTFVANLAICDTVYIITTAPEQLLYHILNVYFNPGVYTCYIQYYLQNISALVSVYTLVCIAVDRYLRICIVMNTYSYRPYVMVIASLWILSALINLPRIIYTVITTEVISGVKLTFCDDSWPTQYIRNVYNIIVDITVFYFIPIILFAVFYLLILMKVWNRKIYGDSTLEVRQKEQIHRSKMKTLKMFLIIFFVFIILWLPNTIVYMCRILNVDMSQRYFDLIHDSAVFFSLVNSCVNFIIYAFLDKRYKKSFLRIIKFPKKLISSVPSSKSHTGSTSNPSDASLRVNS
ncbi:Uncharacterised protein g8315 [Pycnogonum litorale]